MRTVRRTALVARDTCSIRHVASEEQSLRLLTLATHGRSCPRSLDFRILDRWAYSGQVDGLPYFPDLGTEQTERDVWESISNVHSRIKVTSEAFSVVLEVFFCLFEKSQSPLPLLSRVKRGSNLQVE